LKKLVSINSVSGNEKEYADYIVSLLDKDFDVEKIPVEKDRYNIKATKGNPKIYLNTHLDTVPVGDNELKEDENFVYGRGSCDSKGSMAAMLVAALELAKEEKTDFGLFFNVGEETDFCGIKNGLPEENPGFVVIGEPTNLAPFVGQKGLLGFDIIAKGKKAHGATPEKGECAITKLSEAVSKLKKLDFPEDKILGKSALNIGFIRGGEAINVVPDTAKISCEIRTVKENEKYKKLLEETFSDYEINYFSSFNPRVVKDENLIKEIEELTGKESKVQKLFTELYFWPKGIILGPGNSEQAHSDKEFVKKKELKKAVELYEKIIKDFVD